MKIALFSDVHANLPALEAFFIDVDLRNIDAIYCLGDLVGYNVWPNEVIEEIRNRKIPTIAGNHDVKVVNLEPATDFNLSGKDYAYHILTAKGRQYLKTLPRHIRLEFQLEDYPLTVLLVHGSPRSIDEYLSEELPESYIAELLSESNADVLCFGHTHKPYHRSITLNGRDAHLINTGSVGKPKDGNPQGSYVLLTLNPKVGASKSWCTVEIIRFNYAVEKAAQAIENSPLPVVLAEQLRKAY